MAKYPEPLDKVPDGFVVDEYNRIRNSWSFLRRLFYPHFTQKELHEAYTRAEKARFGAEVTFWKERLRILDEIDDGID